MLCVAMDAYGSALLEMGNCSLDACPGLGDDLKKNLERFEDGPFPRYELRALAVTGTGVRGTHCAFGAGTPRSTISRRPAK